MLYGTTKRFLILIVVSTIAAVVAKDIPDGCMIAPDGVFNDNDCATVLSFSKGYSYICAKVSIEDVYTAYTCCDHFEGEDFAFSDKTDLFTCQRNAVDDADSNMEAESVDAADSSLEDMDVGFSENEESSSAGVSVIAALVLTGAVAALF